MNYACLDCDFECDTEVEMNNHIDQEHNEDYGLGQDDEED